MDLIDFRGLPNENLKYILHIKDHFTRFSQAYPLSSKEIDTVALKLFELFTEIRPLTILQSDNRREFISKVWQNQSLPYETQQDDQHKLQITLQEMIDMINMLINIG